MPDGFKNDHHRFDCMIAPCDCGFDFRRWAHTTPDGEAWVDGLHNVRDIQAMLAAFTAGQRSILSRVPHLGELILDGVKAASQPAEDHA
jgi:hypothetical protein